MRKLIHIFVLLLIVVNSSAFETTLSTNLKTHFLTDRTEELLVGEWVSYFMPKGVKKSHEQYLKELWNKNKYYRKGLFWIIGVYIDATTKILIQDKYGLLEVFPYGLLKGYKPNIKSAVNPAKYFKSMLIDKNNAYKNKEFIIISNYIAMNKHILCRNRYGLLKILPKHLVNNTTPNIQSAVDQTQYLVNQFIEKYGLRYGYDGVIYNGYDTPVQIWCKIHKEYFPQTPNNHLSGQGCPKCSASQGEEKIAKYLKELNINFHKEYKFDNCKHIKKLPFDFYLPDHNTLIEYDGIQHFKPIGFFGGKKAFLKTQKLDNIKNVFAKENGYNLIRIPHTQFDEIENLMKQYV